VGLKGKIFVEEGFLKKEAYKNQSVIESFFRLGRMINIV